MASMNHHYTELQDSYLFRTIDAKVSDYLKENPQKELLKLGIGDVTLPLPAASIQALHQAVDEQAKKETFQGYQAEAGSAFFRQAVQDYYQSRGITLDQSEIFVSSGAKDDLADLLDIFARGMKALVLEPAYPAYVDANVISGNTVLHLPSSADDGFAPLPDPSIDADVVYLCSPNNPTGAVYSREKLEAWVAWAQEKQAVIIFDAAYEAFIQDPAIPHSIYEIEGAKDCAIEVCSFSKTAGFTGTRCGFTLVPQALMREGVSLNALWVRNRTTKTNGISYILQHAAAAALSPEGRAQCQENIAIYQQNARIIMEALESANVWYCGGKNAPYIWMRCPGKLSSWDFFDKLLTQEQVVGTPGSGFGECGEGYFRLTAFNTPEKTREAAKRLARLCRALQ